MYAKLSPSRGLIVHGPTLELKYMSTSSSSMTLSASIKYLGLKPTSMLLPFTSTLISSLTAPISVLEVIMILSSIILNLTGYFFSSE